MVIRISNREARRLLLYAQGLSKPSSKAPLIDIVHQLGLVQLDAIQIVARAHHHILWSRQQRYRESGFAQLLERDRSVFEHFSHDASILPMAFYPYWRRRFVRLAAKFEKSAWGKEMAPADERQKIRDRIADEGPLCTRDFTGQADKSLHLWMRPPHKLALDYLWYSGELAISHRRNFVKYYDLAERVIPQPLREKILSEQEQIDWLCHEALSRLYIARPGEIQKFWGAVSAIEVKSWIVQNADTLIEVEIETVNEGTYRALATPDIEVLLASSPSPTSRLRIINPFDPLVRDRNRLKRLFGFDYRIEIFTPAAKREYGYYVYPMLEGDRFIGRIEVKCDRKQKLLLVENIWMESGIPLGTQRRRKLASELQRMSRLVGGQTVVWRNH